MTGDVGEGIFGFEDDVAGDLGHDSYRLQCVLVVRRWKGGQFTYTNGDILGGGKEPVNQDTHEGGVKAEFDRKLRQLCICHTLRDDDGTDSNTYHVSMLCLLRPLFSS